MKANSEVILIILLSNGTVIVQDGWLPGYSAPEIKERPNFVVNSVKNSDGFVSVSLTRPIVATISKNTVDLSKCLYFLYPIGGGSYSKETGKISMHLGFPITSDSKICF